jgi:hypothetical protein
MRAGKAWWRWVLGALLFLAALFGLRKLRRRGDVIPLRPGDEESRPARPAARGTVEIPRAARNDSSRGPLPLVAALLVGVAIVVGLTVTRPSAGSPPPAAVVPSVVVTPRVAQQARPTPFRPATRVSGATRVVQPTATPHLDVLVPRAGETSTAVAEPAVGGTPLAAVRALGMLRGMGYNPTYATADVPPAVRARLLGRDMRLMSEVGVDMVLGWEPGVFDEQLLEAARANNIGVILPFDLKPAWDYSDRDLRARVMREVSDWVIRYRDQPGILMWGVGNEVTLEMGDAERRAFAEFYVELFELVRALDPSRPVTLREAEDVFAPYLAEAFARRQGIWVDPPTPTAAPEEVPAEVSEGEPISTATPEPTPTPRPVIQAPTGFVFGVNFYTERVGSALVDWVANTGFDAPLLVSEYAPAGVGRAIRGDGFLRLHELILAGRPRVLGEAPYTWTTAGPEAVDDYFGLVDADGHPVDNTLVAIATMYGVTPPAWTRVDQPRQQLANVADLPRLLQSAVAEDAELTGRSEDEVRAAAAVEIEIAADELGVAPDDPTEGAARARQVIELIGWARELSTIGAAGPPTPDGRKPFQGMKEALPLLNGMARWSVGEPSAVDTARGFMASVLRRDLTALGG